jgi:hypothetical protein
MGKQDYMKLKRRQKKWSLHWRDHPQSGRIFTGYTSDKQLLTRIYRELKNLTHPKSMNQ